jgi:hypothetical protein
MNSADGISLARQSLSIVEVIHMPQRAIIPALALAALLVGTSMAPVPAAAESATQSRENRANHDRWARNAPAENKATSGDDEDDDSDSDATTSAKAIHMAAAAKIHDGELNGNLHLKGW